MRLFRRNNKRLYLSAPLKKEDAKRSGVKWNAKVEKWYLDCSPRKYVKYSKWLLGNRERTYVATNFIFIVENLRRCWKCHRPTKVVGLGLSEVFYIYDDNGKARCEVWKKTSYSARELHLAWVDREEDIPPGLLKYLQENYSVWTSFSKTTKSFCFANHCDYCGILQGNHYIFYEVDSPLSVNEYTYRRKRRGEGLKIKVIPIKDNIKLDWNVILSSEDSAYFTYGKAEIISLSADPDSISASYEDLYDL